MNKQKIVQQHHATFEGIRQMDADANELWSARELAPLLDDQDWRNFMQVVDKARLACEQSGRPVADHFGDVTKMVPIGSGALRPVPDVHLSRYACYLIVQNGDPGKPVIANRQTYFATQTRRSSCAVRPELVEGHWRRLVRVAKKNPLMVRQAHHERNQKTGRPELVEGHEHAQISVNLEHVEGNERNQKPVRPEPVEGHERCVAPDSWSQA